MPSFSAYAARLNRRTQNIDFLQRYLARVAQASRFIGLKRELIRKARGDRTIFHREAFLYHNLK